MKQTLYQKYGGISIVQQLVGIFHGRLVGDQELEFLCGGLDWKPLVRYETAFFAEILGGPQLFSSDDLLRNLRRFNLSNRQYDLITLHLMFTLEAAGIEALDRAELMRALARMRADVVPPVDTEFPLGKGLQRYQELMEKAAGELEKATRELTGVRNLIVNQHRLRELVLSLAGARERLSEHADLYEMVDELRSMV